MVVCIFSAREEPETIPKTAAPKKAGPKRVTNATLAERLFLVIWGSQMI